MMSGVTSSLLVILCCFPSNVLFVIPPPRSNLRSVISDTSLSNDKLQVLLVITGNADHTCRWLSSVSHVAPPTFPLLPHIAHQEILSWPRKCLEMLKVHVLVSLVSGQPLAQANLDSVEGGANR